MTKWKKDFYEVMLIYQKIYKKVTVTVVIPFKTVFSRFTFDCNHNTESMWIGLNQAYTSRHCSFTPFFKLCQVSWVGVWTALFKSSHKCYIGIWLGHSRTFTLLSLNHFCVAFALSLSCWKTNLSSYTVALFYKLVSF